VRALCGISELAYTEAFEKVTKAKFSEGRSGAFTFYSSDMSYIVKTQKKEEVEALVAMMPEYLEYISNSPATMLVKFLGAHQITMYGKDLYMLVMTNIFPSNEKIEERYDLKGSWSNRQGRAGVLVSKLGNVDRSDSPLYLDNDVMHKINVAPSLSNALYVQVKSDVEWLASQDLMDYSLLIGVVKSRYEVLDSPAQNVSVKHLEDMSRGSDRFFEATYVESDQKYYLGIIDVLQKYTWRKRLEYIWKVWCKRLPHEGVSCIEPTYYCNRFLRRVMLKLFTGIDKSHYITAHETMRKGRAAAEDLEYTGRNSNKKTPYAGPMHRLSTQSDYRVSVILKDMGITQSTFNPMNDSLQEEFVDNNQIKSGLSSISESSNSISRGGSAPRLQSVRASPGGSISSTASDGNLKDKASIGFDLEMAEISPDSTKMSVLSTQEEGSELSVSHNYIDEGPEDSDGNFV
jgi:hypothetical protein